MIKIGLVNKLIAFRMEPQGLYLLEKESMEEVLLPGKYIPEGLEMGDSLEVFVYKDSEDREVATTERPLISLNEIQSLKVADVNQVGAFLNWGLEKDLLLPYAEQLDDLREGENVVVFLTLDYKSERLMASAKIDRILSNEEVNLNEGDEVELFVYKKTDLGYNVVVNGIHKGLIYSNDVFESIKNGDQKKGYVKKVREDGKLDISLQKQGFEMMDHHMRSVIDKLKENNGQLALHDKSSPEAIKSQMGMSKKAFKRAIGMLYKEKMIVIKNEGVELRIES